QPSPHVRQESAQRVARGVRIADAQPREVRLVVEHPGGFAQTGISQRSDAQMPGSTASLVPGKNSVGASDKPQPVVAPSHTIPRRNAMNPTVSRESPAAPPIRPTSKERRPRPTTRSPARPPNSGA